MTFRVLRIYGRQLVTSVNSASNFKVKLYQAQVQRGGKSVPLGCFVTAEEAALCFARSREAHAAVVAAAAPPIACSESSRIESTFSGEIKTVRILKLCGKRPNHLE